MARNYDFALELTRFVQKLGSMTAQLQQQVKEELRVSVVDGSSLTGSQGVPIDTNLLRESYTWKELGSAKSQLSSNRAYAGVIEFDDKRMYDPRGVWDKEGRTRTRLKTGQRGSVRITIAGWQNIVAHVAQGVKTKQTVTGSGMVRRLGTK